VGYLQYAWRVCRRLFALRREVALVHLHSVRPFYFLIVACCKILGMPVVQSPTLVGHDDPATLESQSTLWKLESRTYRHYDRVVCKSTAIRRSCIEAGLPHDRLIRIPGAVPCGTPDSPFRPARDREEIERIRERLGLPKSSFITTFVGRVQRRKGSDLLFDAWELLLRTPAFEGHLLLVGPTKQPTNGANVRDREFAARIEALRDAARDKRVVFAGDVDHEAVPDYLRVSDCFVFPSVREGLPKAPIEAMATGLPVICSLIPGVTEDLIEDGTEGLVLRDRSADELARMIDTVRRDSALRERLSAAAQEKVRRVFAIDIVADKHLKLYRELIG